ncbi:hypothetical protein DFH09DRAFT_1092329 [Mycena vulgaris]|nr:hypothetical protein DFH09DRAFT_1092329 [Mycena vulgaris]
MDIWRPKFRPTLLKPPSQARPEPFLISRPSNQYASSHQETTGTSSAHALSAKAYGRVPSERIRAALTRLKEAKTERVKGESEQRFKQMNPHRSAAQRVRRQYPTQALDRALDHEYDGNEPRRQDRYPESYRSRMHRYVAEHHGAS